MSVSVSPTPRTTSRSGWSMVRAILGLRTRTRIGPATYIERDTKPLASALASGATKLYDVEFEGAPPMRIRVSTSRPYPDLTGPASFEPYLILTDQITPGQRVLDASCGSGAGAAWLAHRVGPSGGVVALDTDHEFIRFARRRYRADHLGFELGSTEALAGELDGSFHAVILHAAPPPHLPLEPKALAECWRVTAPAGLLAVLLPPGEASLHTSSTSIEASKLIQTLIRQSVPVQTTPSQTTPGQSAPGTRLERHSPVGHDLAALIVHKPASRLR